MMLKMQNKMESSDKKFAEEFRELNESFEQLEEELATTKNANMLDKCPGFWEIIYGNCGYTHFSPG